METKEINNNQSLRVRQVLDHERFTRLNEQQATEYPTNEVKRIIDNHFKDRDSEELPTKDIEVTFEFPLISTQGYYTVKTIKGKCIYGIDKEISKFVQE